MKANPQTSSPDPEMRFRALCEALSRLESPKEYEKFLIDLCTPAELVALSDRWLVAKLLDRGIPYREIYGQTGVSTATVTRVARSLLQGEGGYRLALGESTKRKGARDA